MARTPESLRQRQRAAVGQVVRQRHALERFGHQHLRRPAAQRARKPQAEVAILVEAQRERGLGLVPSLARQPVGGRGRYRAAGDRHDR